MIKVFPTDISIKFKEAITWFLIFTVLSILLEAIGQLILFFLSDIQSYEHIPYILKTLFIQCLLFLTITFLTMKWIWRKYYFLAFPTILFLLLNFVFLFNLEWTNGKAKFITSFPSFPLDCYDYNASVITDISNLLIKPLEGIFDGGIFCPDNTAYFYILFAVIPLVGFYTIFNRHLLW